RCAGRVEVKHQGQWGTVCDDDWDMEDAAVVCRQLGCGSAREAHEEAFFGPGSDPIWMSEVQCDGTESALSDCTHSGWGQHDCYHRWDAGVTCTGSCSSARPARPAGLCLLSPLGPGRSLPSADREKLRAMGGENGCSGRVELWHRGSWGTVCDDSWDMQDAQVACRQLGCG
ncbi:DMBT1 protein, partial [Halcyon senegalensis]|nr:DMBT1 protein [Halcyon senegalensis]